VTEATLQQMAATPDPRLRRIGDAAACHLHPFVREVNLTPADEHRISDRNRQGCTAIRQEFISARTADLFFLTKQRESSRSAACFSPNQGQDLDPMLVMTRSAFSYLSGNLQ
jgi:hypothetical protein